MKETLDKLKVEKPENYVEGSKDKLNKTFMKNLGAFALIFSIITWFGTCLYLSVVDVMFDNLSNKLLSYSFISSISLSTLSIVLGKVRGGKSLTGCDNCKNKTNDTEKS